MAQFTQGNTPAQDPNARPAAVLNVEDQRVGKLDSPLLVIGLGGTGISLLNEIRQVFSRRYELAVDTDGKKLGYPPRTAYLGIDTDANSQGTLNQDEFCRLFVNNLHAMLQNRNVFAPHELAWLDPQFNVLQGGAAGSIRQASRLMLGRCYGELYGKLTDALHRISAAKINAHRPGRLEIVICAGISGGTGSGLFLDIPQIIRQYLSTHQISYRITGYLVMPDATFAMNPSIHPNNYPTFQANAYAALKELDFWQRAREHRTPYSITYDLSPNGTVQWLTQPYDACVLLCATNVKGTRIKDCGAELKRIVAENLLHYLAQEDVHADVHDAAQNQDPQFSYISHEDNIHNLLVTSLPNARTPMSYAYRVIGAYSSAIPKRKMVAYEALQLMDTFMPKPGINGTLAVNELLITNQTLPTRVSDVLPGIKADLEDIISRMLPDFALTEPTDGDAVRSLQEGTPPHQILTADGWGATEVYPVANSAARNYLEKAWGCFVAFANEIMCDPDQGSFALERYLTNETQFGFMPALRKKIEDYSARCETAKVDKKAAYEACVNTYAHFKRPPLLSHTTAVRTYLGNLEDYYTQIIREIILHNYLSAMRHLTRRIERFTILALSPMNKDLLALQKEQQEQLKAAGSATLELVSMEVLAPRIDDIFATQNKDGQITLTYLRALSEMVTATETTQDVDTSYLTFCYADLAGASGHYAALRETLDKAFSRVFDGNLDSLLLEECHGNPALVDEMLRDKLGQLTTATTPMFAYSKALEDFKVEFTYMSIPRNSQLLKNYMQTQNAADGFTAKESSITDRVFCLYTWDGLSLSQYSELPNCERAYQHMMAQPQTSAGLHLVCTRSPKPIVANDWSLLPSPAPHYFFGRTPALQSEAIAFDRLHQLVKDAVACGMLSIRMDAGNPHPEYTVRLFYTDNVNGIMRKSEDLIADVETIYKKPLSAPERIAQIDAMLARANLRTLKAACRVDIMNTYCGFGPHDRFDPTDPAIQHEAALVAAAQANLDKMTVAFGAALVAADPALREKIEMQLCVFEKIAQVRDALVRSGRVWEDRLAFAESCCAMILNDVIFLKTTGYFYKDAAGTNQRLYSLDSDALPEDLSNETCDVLQACGYLAALDPETSEVRRYLTARLENAQRMFEESEQNDELTLEDFEALVDNAEMALQSVQDGLREKTNLKMNGQAAQVERPMQVLSAMQTYLEARLRIYRRAIRLLSKK